MIETARLLTTGCVAIVGLGCSVWLWRHSAGGAESPRWGNELLRGRRPWRRLGAAIVGFVAVVFFAGVNFIDANAHPRAFLGFWMLVLLLILWLCALALVDTIHTLRLRTRLLRQTRQRCAGPASSENNE